MFLWYDSCFYVRYIDSTIVNVAFQRTISNTRQKTKYVYFTKIDEVAFLCHLMKPGSISNISFIIKPSPYVFITKYSEDWV